MTFYIVLCAVFVLFVVALLWDYDVESGEKVEKDSYGRKYRTPWGKRINKWPHE